LNITSLKTKFLPPVFMRSDSAGVSFRLKSAGSAGSASFNPGDLSAPKRRKMRDFFSTLAESSLYLKPTIFIFNNLT
jgi:hypothetical protein